MGFGRKKGHVGQIGSWGLGFGRKKNMSRSNWGLGFGAEFDPNSQTVKLHPKLTMQRPNPKPQNFLNNGFCDKKTHFLKKQFEKKLLKREGRSVKKFWGLGFEDWGLGFGKVAFSPIPARNKEMKYDIF